MAAVPAAGPGVEDARHALQVAQAVQAIYLDAEDALFQSLADHLWKAARAQAKAPSRIARLEQLREQRGRRGQLLDQTPRRRRETLAELGTLAAGGEDPRMVREYLERRNREVRQLRQEAGRIITRLERRVFPTVTEALTSGWRRGVQRAIDDIDNLGGRKGVPTGQGVVEIARQMVRNLRRRHISALRTIDDLFQQVNRNAIGRALAGAESIDEVVERELRDYARRGVTRFVDRAGKSWDLPTYAEMAVRTSVIRAATDAHTRTLAGNGHRFVIVTKEAFSCPRCAPFEGEILAISDDGPTGDVQVTNFLTDEPITIHVRATVEFARRVGFQHPNCGHTMGLYTPGVTQTPARPQSKASYEDSQRQRRLERQLRVAKRESVLARTPARQKAARQKAREVAAELNELAEEKGLPRRRRQERVRDISPEEVAQARQTRQAAIRARREAVAARERVAARRERERRRSGGPPESTGSAPMSGDGDQPDSGGTGGGDVRPRGGGPAPAGPAPQGAASRVAEERRPEPQPEREDAPASAVPDRDDRPEDAQAGDAEPDDQRAQEARQSLQQARGQEFVPGSEREQATVGQSLARRERVQAPERLWTRDLPDPADRPDWFTRQQLDDRQIIDDPDGSQVVVVAGEVIGRVRQSQSRRGEWFGQHTDRSQVNRRSASHEQVVDELLEQASQRWRDRHADDGDQDGPGPARVAAERNLRQAEEAAQAAEQEFEAATQRRREAEQQGSVTALAPAAREQSAASRRLQEVRQELARARAQARQSQSPPARTRRPEQDVAAAAQESRELNQLRRNLRDSNAELDQARDRLEEAEQALEFARRWRPDEVAEAQRAVTEAGSTVDRLRRRTREAERAVAEQRGTVFDRRFGDDRSEVRPDPQMADVESQVLAEHSPRHEAETAELRQRHQETRQRAATELEQAEQALPAAVRQTHEERTRLEQLVRDERARLRAEGVSDFRASQQVRQFMLGRREPLTAAEQAERAARARLAAAQQAQDELEGRQRAEERALLDRHVRELAAARRAARSTGR